MPNKADKIWYHRIENKCVNNCIYLTKKQQATKLSRETAHEKYAILTSGCIF